MFKIIFFFILISMILGCSSGDKYWEISKFHIEPNVLKQYEEIKLLYSSRDVEHKNDRDYYIHLVVVSQKTGDTTNILTNSDSNFQQSDGNKVFNFLPNVESYKVPVNFTKVARDIKFDHIANNHFPTIIGSIGEYFSGNRK